MNAIEALAEFVATTRLAAIPDDVADRASLMIADCVGCIVAGNAVPEVRRLVGSHRGRGPCEATVIGTGIALSREAAAFVNGIAGTWYDLDEGNLSTRTHAAIQIVPAVLAEAEACGLSGSAALESLILAYEAGARLWRATTVRHAVHPHGTFGPLAAALALGRLRGLSPPDLARGASMALTLGIAASRRTLNDGATIRNTYTGFSGRHGFEALTLLEAGFSGETDAAASILGSIYGSSFDATAAIADLGHTWWLRRNYFKRFASVRYAHGPLDLIDELCRRLGSRLCESNIERIDIETYFFATTIGQQAVLNPFGCRFSIPMLIAARIVQGPSSMTDDGGRAFADPVVRELASRIFIVEDKAATNAYPDRQPTRIAVMLRGGGTERIGSERILGESDYPLPAGAMMRKFEELVALGWSGGAGAAWQDLLNIRNGTDIGHLMGGWRKLAKATEIEEKPS